MTLQLGPAYQALAGAALALGRLDDARRLVDRAVEFSAGRQGLMAHALQLRGDMATQGDSFDAETGETHYRRVLALAEPRGMRPVIAHCHLGLGKQCRRVGRQEQADEHFTTATTPYREMDMPFWLEQAGAKESSWHGRNLAYQYIPPICIEDGANDVRSWPKPDMPDATSHVRVRGKADVE